MDKVEAQKAFKEKNSFSFPLLADSSGDVVKAFGVKKINNSRCARQSFVVKDGIVIWNDPKASTGDHADDVLKVLDRMEKASKKKN